MTATKTTKAAAAAPDPEATAATDPVHAATAAEVARVGPAEPDLRDIEIARLRQQLAERDAADADAAADPAKAGEKAPTPFTLFLACGHAVEAPNPATTSHFCREHGVSVPVTGVVNREA